MRRFILFAPIILVIAWFGCESSSEPDTGTGELKVLLVDSPAAYDEVNIVVSSVAVHTSASAPDNDAGWATINDVPATYDLLELRNGTSAVLGTNRLAPAHYTQMRLLIGSGSNVVVDGTSYPLEIPSGIQSGVKLTHAFTIEENTLYELTLDFDADKSIFRLGTGTYRLQPTIRVVATITSGTISGVVQPDTARAVIYALSGTDTVATAYADTVSGAFKLMALPEGTYSVSVSATEGSFQDALRTGVAVVRQQDTNLGTITLTP